MSSKLVWIALLLILPTQRLLTVQGLSNGDRSRARDMLRTIAEDVRRNYYDPKLHGFDFDGRVRDADQKLKQATSLDQAFAVIAWTLEGLQDSHTYFIPPGVDTVTEYGWRMQMIGSHCFVTHVKPNSDADEKGLKPGDEVLRVDSSVPSRNNFVDLEYVLNVLAPRRQLRLQVRGLDGLTRQLQVSAKVREIYRPIDFGRLGKGERSADIRCLDANQVEICKMEEFASNERDIQAILHPARKHAGLILDLRGNPGGSVLTLERLIGSLFDDEIKIGDRVGRSPMKPSIATPQHDRFAGRLVVLVDSDSASAAEVFARVMQLEKRGTVLGDRSAGLVMEGQLFRHVYGAVAVFGYGAVITRADLLMKDGKSLENRGVLPDQVLLPSADDLASGRDPVMARAAELLGAEMTSEAAGKLFPYEW